MPKTVIRKLTHYLPEQILGNEELARSYEGWTADKIVEKTGFRSRRVVRPDQCSSDLAEAAVRRLFESGGPDPAKVDLLVLCTQSPDYYLPTTACLLQDRLGLPTSCGAFDFNLGCSGFVYGLAIVKGLIDTGVASNALLVTAETYSRFIHPADKSVRTIFGDAASATWISSVDDEAPGSIGPFVLGTDGKGGPNLIVPVGGLRRPHPDGPLPETVDDSGNTRTDANLFMNGPEIFEFTLRRIPKLVRETLAKSGVTQDQISQFVFHQANTFMLQHLRKSLRLDEAKFPIGLQECGNTVSATIPMMLEELSATGRLSSGDQAMLVGFGVGYSWASCMLKWH